MAGCAIDMASFCIINRSDASDMTWSVAPAIDPFERVTMTTVPQISDLSDVVFLAISRQLDVPVKKITFSTDLPHDLRAGQIDMIEIFQTLEVSLGIVANDDTVLVLCTAGDCVDYVRALVRGESPQAPEIIQARLRARQAAWLTSKKRTRLLALVLLLAGVSLFALWFGLWWNDFFSH
jgi:hypothetical protein